MVCTQCQQFGGGAMPLSYVNPSFREPSAFSGPNRVFSEVGLARPAMQHTGGRRSKRTRSRRLRRRGGFYPSVMGGVLSSGPKLLPVAAVTGYRMCKNYKKSSTKRKQRK